MIRYFFSPLWQSIKNLKRNFWMTFASITSMVITLALLGVVSAVLLNVEKVASNVENKVQISVYLNYDSTDGAKEITDLSGQTGANPNYHKIYNQIKKIDGVKSITYSSKDQELKKLQKTSPDTFKSLEGDANPLQDVYYIKVSKDSQVKSVAKSIKKISGVEDVTYGGSDADQMISFLRGVRLWGIVGVVAFIIIAILLTSNTVRLTIRARKRDIEIMRLVGAKNSYIRGPFFFEGAWIGVLGAILPTIILYVGYQFVYKDLVSNYKGLVLYTPQEFLPYGIGALFAFGIIIGAFASTLSMRRYLRT
ncbi:permease-like cell division protein FtsX [Streptococcus sciuri]|uniref:Cell division protein FtsX n=1 Tax=Streptococcus sciuri TaxID=2973939 RepID=A0ABT2F5V7_9STRE|nr:permease-like cell division protein FtsX [Streptococcus sciuri]MCS4487824.1 permease-like cell division protein FtsX [Streptococcus sciuri]